MHTAYIDQFHDMVKNNTSLDTRKKIFQDLEELINEKRKELFRPIIMMDANDNYLEEKSDNFRNFITKND